MNKNELIQLIESICFPREEYYILGGGCLVIRGIRNETKDLDLCISRKLFDEIQKKFNLNDSCKNKKGFYRISPLIEAIVEGEYPFEFDIVEGYQVQKLELLLYNKKHSGKEKDIKDVILINDFLTRK